MEMGGNLVHLPAFEWRPKQPHRGEILVAPGASPGTANITLGRARKEFGACTEGGWARNGAGIGWLDSTFLVVGAGNLRLRAKRWICLSPILQPQGKRIKMCLV